MIDESAFGQVHQHGAAIGWMRLAPREAGRLERVDERRDVARSDADALRELACVTGPPWYSTHSRWVRGWVSPAPLELALLVGLEHL